MRSGLRGSQDFVGHEVKVRGKGYGEERKVFWSEVPRKISLTLMPREACPNAQRAETLGIGLHSNPKWPK